MGAFGNEAQTVVVLVLLEEILAYRRGSSALPLPASAQRDSVTMEYDINYWLMIDVILLDSNGSFEVWS